MIVKDHRPKWKAARGSAKGCRSVNVANSETGTLTECTYDESHIHYSVHRYLYRPCIAVDIPHHR